MDSLSALWPYLMGALIGWMASWGLAHRFKYATDSAKTIKVEKIVEKMVEVDRPELLDRIADLEALAEDYEDQVATLRAAAPKVKQIEKRVEVDRPALVAKVAELESTLVKYRDELDQLRTARRSAEASNNGSGSKETRAQKPARATTDKTEQVPANRQVEFDRSTLLARVAEMKSSTRESGKVPAQKSRSRKGGSKASLPEAEQPGTSQSGTGLSGTNPPMQNSSVTSPVARAQVAPRPAKPGARAIERVVDTTPKPQTRKPAARSAKKPGGGPTESQLALPVVEVKGPDVAPAVKTEAPRNDPAVPPPAEKPLQRNGNGIDWAAARSLGFKFKDPGKTADFSYVEGIGPKISSLLHDAGINSYRDLANAESTAIRDILDRAGPRYRLADPVTWPRQAAMIADSRWQELKDWKQHLKVGRAGGKEA